MAKELSSLQLKRLWRLYNKAASFMANDNLKDAKATCQKIFKINSDDINAHKIYGMILKHESHFEDALASFSIVLKHQSVATPSDENDYLDITMYLFECLEALGHHDKVVEKTETLIQKFPFDIRLLYLKAKRLAKQGDILSALEHYKQVVLFPSRNDKVHQEIKAYSHLYIMTAPSLNPIQADIDLINSTIQQTDDEYIHSTLSFAKAHGLERLSRYSEAMEAFQTANQLMWPTNRLDFQQMLESFAKIQQVDWANEALIIEPERQETMPCFIEGVPRSGSTLVESVLAEIPGMLACGEVPYLAKAIKKAASSCKVSEQNIVLNPTISSLLAVKKSYLEHLKSEHQLEHMFIDKMLNNYDYIGLKALIFPNARFIYVHKNLLDAAFSMYRQTFKLGEHTYTYHLKACAFMVKYAQECMVYWQSIFPNRIFDLSYEKCLLSGEESWQLLFQWLKLEWNSDYLEFYRSKRSVETISSAQVRERLTPQYIDRSDKYGKLLDELRDYLNLPLTQLAKFN